MTATGADEEVRFPALDPEPPPRSWRWRIGAAGATVGAAAAVGALAFLIASLTTGSSHPSASPSGPVSTRSTGGRVVYLSTAGVFGTSSASGGGTTALPALGTHAVSGGTYAIPSPDGRYMVSSDGSVLEVANGRITRQASRLAITDSRLLAGIEPFSGDDADVVVLNGGYTGYPLTNASVSLVNWRTGTSQTLGTGDQNGGVAGDPDLPGAFVPIALPVSSAGEGDSRIELRDMGRPARVLVTARELNGALHQPTTLSVVLSPFPDNDGGKIAVSVNASTHGTGPSIGLVIVDRAGHVLASLTGPNAPEAGYGVTWSPDGRSLAYISDAPAGASVTVWTPSPAPSSRQAALVTRLLPEQYLLPSGCVWSPDSSSILCTATDPQTQTGSWLSAPARAGTLALGAAPGQPVEWLGATT